MWCWISRANLEGRRQIAARTSQGPARTRSRAWFRPQGSVGTAAAGGTDPHQLRREADGEHVFGEFGSSPLREWTRYRKACVMRFTAPTPSTRISLRRREREREEEGDCGVRVQKNSIDARSCHHVPRLRSRRGRSRVRTPPFQTPRHQTKPLTSGVCASRRCRREEEAGVRRGRASFRSCSNSRPGLP